MREWMCSLFCELVGVSCCVSWCASLVCTCELVHTCEFVRYPRYGSRINDDRVTKLALHHPIS